jgi:hypothetical protein
MVMNSTAAPFLPLNQRHVGHFLRWLIIFALALVGGTILAHASDTKNDFTGEYVLAGAKADRSFQLDVKLDHSRADISFSAAMNDGSGAAPDGEGHGSVEDGVLSFKFKDSFDNEGTCTLKPDNGVYRLSMTVLKIADVSPIHFYGDVPLRKVSSHPSNL